MPMKSISIILCTYNGAAYLPQQMDSLLEQTYPFDELIVQDDGSTDDTVRIIRNYQQQHPDRNIRFYINEQRLGYNRNFLTAIRRATGEYIACCDQDDVWMANKLEMLMNRIGNHTLIFHNSLVMAPDTEVRPMYAHPLPQTFPALYAALYPRSYGHQMLFRKEVLERLTPFDPYNVSYDYLLFTLASSLGTVCYLHTPLVYWRRHQAAATYRASSHSAGKWEGYVKAIGSLWKRHNRQSTRLYFSLLQQVPFRHATARRAVGLLAKGNVSGILSACLLCLRHRQEAAPEVRGALQSLRAFFLPLFFIRDHARYIIQLNNQNISTP